MPQPVADDWEGHWGAYAKAAEANPAQEFRRGLILRRMRRGDRLRVIDIGSGQGDLLQTISEWDPGAELLGIELSRAGVEVARRKMRRATFLQHDLLLGPAAAAPYHGWASRAVCSEVLEHVDDPVELLRNAAPCLAPGCQVIVTVPGGPRSAFDRHIGHRRHYRRAELRALLLEAGLADVVVHAAGFPFFNLYKLLVIARGERLIQEVRDEPDAAPSSLALFVMRAIRPLLRCTIPNTPFGWQLVATATYPG